MNNDILCLDIPNHFSNPEISGNPEIFNYNNDELSNNNQKNALQQKLNLFSNNYHLDNSFIDIKNESNTELDKDEDEEKEIKLNIDVHKNNNNINNNYFCHIYNNINNNIDNNNIINNNINNNICNCSCNCLKCSQYIPFNEHHFKIPYEDYCLNALFNYENNLVNYNENGKYINFFNKNNQTFLFKNNNNKIEPNSNIFLNINLDIDNNNINNKDKDNKNSKEENDKKHLIYQENNFNNNSMIINNKININLSAKRILKKRKKENKINQIIQYGHPKKINYKTMKQKLNIHKKLDLECRNDTILLIYSVSKLKKILKKLILKENISDKIYYQRIINIYKNSILSLQHREYAQDITGYKLI